MLARYKMYRGPRPPWDPLPNGIRKDTRCHTKHPLRPTKAIVEAFLESPSDAAWEVFRSAYNSISEDRFREDRSPFDDLAALAIDHDVFLGCSCPTKKNLGFGHCHTYLALQFMKRKYPDLTVQLTYDWYYPAGSAPKSGDRSST